MNVVYRNNILHINHIYIEIFSWVSQQHAAYMLSLYLCKLPIQPLQLAWLSMTPHSVGPNSSKGWDMLRANSSLPIGHLHSFHGTSKSTYIYIYHLKNFWFHMLLHCSVLRHVYQRCLSSRTNALTHLKAFRIGKHMAFCRVSESIIPRHSLASLPGKYVIAKSTSDGQMEYAK